ncbi:hypothetical protein J40TS1_34410 [Paenibacillus montaniterrae]|uniref:Uncharacterized protein n=1 Tax=Paenibacillus montaniterrae TaxID=429341 RepID=A0A920D0A9_9BACL|nr:hypothetical protein [Paenibacillus montaniterrae]GIP17799.1 hypothetical protein J40TS1_34410 [Paenibacillus montaniterrae]
MSIEETAEQIVIEAKRGTHTYGEALQNLGLASLTVCPSAGKGVEAYELALDMLQQEMRNQPHNYGKPFD